MQRTPIIQQEQNKISKDLDKHFSRDGQQIKGEA